MKIGIMGAGKIAHTMAKTIIEMHHDDIELYAIGSRSIEKALSFQKKYKIQKAYGSYEELVSDKNLDLIYIATPHSEHYKNAMLCIDYRKPMLIEKSFTTNAIEAIELIKRAEKEKIFVAEAIWTRYMPSTKYLNSIVSTNTIGEVIGVQANLGYKINDVPRLIDPKLSGGALLDVGIYPITFASMIFNDIPSDVDGTCIKYETGVDASDSIFLKFGAKTATLFSTMLARTDRHGYIYGTMGRIEIDNINNPMIATQYDNNDKIVNTIHFEKQITGFEYQVLSCYNALKENKLECEEMPHKLTIEIMRVMDNLRKKWNIKYPFE